MTVVALLRTWLTEAILRVATVLLRLADWVDTGPPARRQAVTPEPSRRTVFDTAELEECATMADVEAVLSQLRSKGLPAHRAYALYEREVRRRRRLFDGFEISGRDE